MSSHTKTAGRTSAKMNVRTMVEIGMLGAISVILMMFEIPLWFAPSFYKIDLSEVPVLIGAFALGPVAGALIDMVKILLHLLLKGTSTAGVGDLANFLIVRHGRSGGLDLPETENKKECHHRSGVRYSRDDHCRKFFKRTGSSAGLMQRLWNAH